MFLLKEHISTSLFTDPLFSLPSSSSARDKKQIRGEFIDCQRSALADVFEKNEKKNKTTSVYRLHFYRNFHGFKS